MKDNVSLVKNYVYNFIKTMMGIFFPIITFSYASRILGAEGVGKVNFSKSIITYFTMIAVLGMNYYGTREAAKIRDDKEQLSKFVHEMLIINGVMTVVAYCLLTVSVLKIPKMHDYQQLILIGSVAIILQSMGMEWLYQALENYRYITIRSVIVQLLSLLLMFVFVRTPDDVPGYMAVTILSTYGSYIFNFFNARKYIQWKRYKGYEIKKHIKPLLLLFFMTLSIQLYTVLDSTMLGFIKNDASVGRYTAAIKINKMMNTLITSIGVVLIPRLSYYIKKREVEKIKELIDISYNYVFLLSIPIAVGLYTLGDEIIEIFSGAGFASAAVTLRILTPIVIVIPFSVVTNIQTFVPMGKEKLIMVSTFTGAVVNMVSNAILIPSYAENGAAVATVAAETIVTVICFFNIRRFFDMKKVFKEYWQYIIATIPIIPIYKVAKIVVKNIWVRTLAVVIISATAYFVILIVLRNPYIYKIIELFGSKIKNKSGDVDEDKSKNK
jgi:O-antigen/teichoic acid export membrane protein